jgi:hypothetical protein
MNFWYWAQSVCLIEFDASSTSTTSERPRTKLGEPVVGCLVGGARFEVGRSVGVAVGFADGLSVGAILRLGQMANKG